MSVWGYLLQQGCCAWSLLLSVGLSIGLRRPHLLRLTAAAVACGVCALCCAMAGSGWIRLAALTLIGAAAPMAAWPGIPPSRRWRMLGFSLVLTLLMSGCSRLLHALGLSRMPLLLAQCALLPGMVLLLPRSGQAACTTVEITHAQRHVTLTALVDSGNLLRDPITHLPVIVISRQAASRLMEEPEFSPGIRLISVRTVAGSALMPIFRPARVRLLLAGGWQCVQAVIGLSPEGYSGFQALVPASVITPIQGGISVCP